MSKQNTYCATIVWTGNLGQGTVGYRGYNRTWEIRTPGKEVIQCSNDPLLGGDPGKPNPEDLLLSALSACHMLWYLHLASQAGIVVVGYEDRPMGVGETSPNGAGRFLGATLRPVIQLEMGTDRKKADSIHEEIHPLCFVARSVNFPVKYEPTYEE